MSDGNTSRTRAKQRWDAQQQAFFQTVASYVKTKELPLVTASTIDDELPRGKTLGAGGLGLDFLCDVEMVTEKVLQGDEPAQRAWFALALGEKVDPDLARRVIQRCGSAYLDAGLDTYFVPSIKHRRGELTVTA